MKNWLWKLYAIYLTSIVFVSLGDLLHKDSPFRTYYTILIAINDHYILFLILNILSLFINLLAPLVVLLYACNIKKWLRFWQALLFVRLLLDLTGHNYDLQFIKSSFYQSFTYGLACIGVFTIPILPSYLAHYAYVFKKTDSNLQLSTIKH